MQTLLKTLKIIPFEEKDQNAVEQLVLPIQQIEFGVAIRRDEQPDLMDISGTFQKGSGNFWVAIDDDRLIGTVGVMDIGNQQVALKKMFVHHEFRGKQYGVAAALMHCAKEWCLQRGIKTILLGTTSQMSAAHRFYEKNGFIEVSNDDLPPNFPLVKVDTKFYSCELTA